MKLFIHVIEKASQIIYVIAVHALMIVFVGLWWNTKLLPSSNGVGSNLFRAVLAIIIYGLFAIDGYRKHYKGGRKLYFIMSSVSPIVLSLIGFVYGLYVIYQN